MKTASLLAAAMIAGSASFAFAECNWNKHGIAMSTPEDKAPMSMAATEYQPVMDMETALEVASAPLAKECDPATADCTVATN